jgi:AcrR family transcriptional regulator
VYVAVVPSRRAQHVQDTRDSLVRAARDLFTERGYQNVGTEEIVQRAGLTRGALYHHFRGKADLFLAVLDEVDRDVVRRGQTFPDADGDAWAEYQRRSNAFLDAATTDPSFRQIVLVDGPAVLGWQAWAARRDNSFATVERLLRKAIASGSLAAQPVEPLAHLLIAAGNQAVLYIANAADPTAARREMGESMTRLLEGLRTSRGR